MIDAIPAIVICAFFAWVAIGSFIDYQDIKRARRGKQ